MKVIYPDKEQNSIINHGIKLDKDNPEWTDEMFKKAFRGKQVAPVKRQLTIRFDPEIIEWFKSSGRGYQSKMNKVLRDYIENHS